MTPEEQPSELIGSTMKLTAMMGDSLQQRYTIVAMEHGTLYYSSNFEPLFHVGTMIVNGCRMNVI